MHVRTLELNGDAAALDEAVTFVREQALPRVTAMPGCRGMTMMVDRDAGRCVVATSWESAEAREASAAGTEAFRARVAALLSAEPHVHEWEIVVAWRPDPVPA